MSDEGNDSQVVHESVWNIYLPMLDLFPVFNFSPGSAQIRKKTILIFSDHLFSTNRFHHRVKQQQQRQKTEQEQTHEGKMITQQKREANKEKTREETRNLSKLLLHDAEINVWEEVGEGQYRIRWDGDEGGDSGGSGW